jgi:hypothetical protein
VNLAKYLLTQAASECVEVAHRISKAQQFGLAETQSGQPESNAERVVGEFMDLLAVMEMLEAEGLIQMPSAEEQEVLKQAKKAKVLKFMQYARDECGTLSELPGVRSGIGCAGG